MKQKLIFGNKSVDVGVDPDTPTPARPGRPPIVLGLAVRRGLYNRRRCVNWMGIFKFRALIVVPALMVTAPAMAKVTFPVTIPQECVELAQREGVSVVINSKYEAAKARFKLARLRDRDPMVHECREAVDRARKTAAQQDSESLPPPPPLRDAINERTTPQ